jgi:hypothetical protein
MSVEIRILSEPPSDHDGPGLPTLDEVAWYMTQDDKLLGIVVRDKVDHDFEMGGYAQIRGSLGSIGPRQELVRQYHGYGGSASGDEGCSGVMKKTNDEREQHVSCSHCAGKRQAN